MRYRQRVIRLEEYQRRHTPPSHFVTSVQVPWDLPADMHQETWLQAEVMCRCGQKGCPDMRIGLVLPEKAPSPEAWAERAQAYYAKRGIGDA
jgi:hypothetical protein